MVGLGQGGLVVAALRWPLVVQLTLQARNLQRKEARSVGEAWAGLKAVWPIRPKLWKTQSEACPELARDFPEPPVRGFEISERAEPEAAADLDQERQEVSLQVGPALLGAQELSSSVLQAWATGFLSSPKKGLVATPLQGPPRLQCSARYGLGPDPRPGHRAVPGRRYRASLLLSRALAQRREASGRVGRVVVVRVNGRR